MTYYADNSLDLTQTNAGQPIDLTGGITGAGLTFDGGIGTTDYLNLTPSLSFGDSSTTSTDQSQTGQTSGTTTTDPYAVGGTAYNDDLNYLNDQETRLKNQLPSIYNTRTQGYQQIDDSYGSALSRSNEDQSRALSGYATQREDTTKGKQSAIGRVNQGAYTLNNSLRRMLGLASGANSSAYQIAAPNAVARDASIKRGGVNDTYARNFRDLDTAETDAKTKFKRYGEDLETERGQRRQDLEAGVTSREQDVYAALTEIARQRALLGNGGYDQVRTATAPYLSKIDSLQSDLDGLFNRFKGTTPTVAPVQVAAPQLSNYNVDRTAINAANQNGGDQYSPYLGFLKKKQGV